MFINSNTYQIYLYNEKDTAKLGAAVSKILLPGLKIYLQGNLGVGKTTFTRSVLHTAGYKGRVKSPTYNLVEIYSIKLKENIVFIIHFDFYRITTPQDFFEAGFQEYINLNNICIIEWPENAKSALPTPDINIYFIIKNNKRSVKLQAFSTKGYQCLIQLEFILNI